MCALASLGLRFFCVAGVGLCALPRGSDVRPGVSRAPLLLRGRRGTLCTAKGSDIRPGVPRAPPLLGGRRGTMCTAEGSDVRPGIPRAPLRLCSRRGTMCTAKHPNEKDKYDHSEQFESCAASKLNR